MVTSKSKANIDFLFVDDSETKAPKTPMKKASESTIEPRESERSAKLARRQAEMKKRLIPVAAELPIIKEPEFPREFGLAEAAELLQVNRSTAAILCARHGCAHYSAGPGGKATRTRKTWKITYQDIIDIRLEMRIPTNQRKK